MTETKEAIMAENQSPKKEIANIQLGANVFSGWREFQAAQRMAEALSASTIVPKDYQKNSGNCLIAIEMANRMGTSPMMVMQNLYIVNGRPAWSSQYIVATINASRKYKTELQYEIGRDANGKMVSCMAYAYDNNNHKVEGPTITMEMAEMEGWVNKSGSKWKTMPEVMMRYRAASFFGRLNCPDMIMGIYTADEVLELDESQYKEVSEVEKVNTEVAENQATIAVDITPEESEPVQEKKQEAAKSQMSLDTGTDMPDEPEF